VDPYHDYLYGLLKYRTLTKNNYRRTELASIQGEKIVASVCLTILTLGLIAGT